MTPETKTNNSQVEVQNENRFLRATSNIYKLWFILTVVYVGMTLLQAFDNPLTGKVAGLLGLFVPIGLFSGSLLFTDLKIGFITIAVLIAFLYLCNEATKKIQSLYARLAVNLLLLLLLTILIDLILYRTWASVYLFLGGSLW